MEDKGASLNVQRSFSAKGRFHVLRKFFFRLLICSRIV
jgi:hypothetical protein